MNRLFWKEGFKAKREDAFLEAMLSVHTGANQWPGDIEESEYWPGVSPGKFGPANALSPKYNQNMVNDLLQSKKKPPLFWIHGKDDNIVSEESYSEPGFQGKMKLREGWPGEKIFPPQPMKSQIKYTLNKYAETGGIVQTKLIDDCGHSPFIEKPKVTFTALKHNLQ